MKKKTNNKNASIENPRRREFLSKAALAASAVGMQYPFIKIVRAQTQSRARRIAILGGGVGGLSAAHELVERGFDVSVYESQFIGGGKARSFPAQSTGRDGRADLPAEHGFRFFASFYTHLPDTMSRIPFAGKPRGVADNLVAPEHLQYAQVGRPEFFIPTRLPRDVRDLQTAIYGLTNAHVGLTLSDKAHFMRRMLVLLTSCTERRYAEYDRVPWWDFIGASSRSSSYQKFLATGLMRNLVACRPRLVSTRTGGYIFLQLLLGAMGFHGRPLDRVLDGPTNDRWIDPWMTYLRDRGVRFYPGVRIEEFHCEGNRIVSVGARENQSPRLIEADDFIAAMPVEVMARTLNSSMTSMDPALARIQRLSTEWMNGIQFYLREDVRPSRGHSIYIDSPWALTSIAQHQFWPEYDLNRRGNGMVRGILSVDVSDWNTPGILFGKPAKSCSASEIRAEVWAQLKAHLNDNGSEILRDDHLIDSHLDPAITFAANGEVSNSEPLLINTAGSWQDRPEASGPIQNLYLASDYVRTYSDLACMEAANEAARRAVNALLDRCGWMGSRCEIWPFREPQVFSPFQEWDRIRFRQGLAHDETNIPAYNIGIL